VPYCRTTRPFNGVFEGTTGGGRYLTGEEKGELSVWASDELVVDEQHTGSWHETRPREYPLMLGDRPGNTQTAMRLSKLGGETRNLEDHPQTARGRALQPATERPLADHRTLSTRLVPLRLAPALSIRNGVTWILTTW